MPRGGYHGGRGGGMNSGGWGGQGGNLNQLIHNFFVCFVCPKKNPSQHLGLGSLGNLLAWICSEKSIITFGFLAKSILKLTKKQRFFCSTFLRQHERFF